MSICDDAMHFFKDKESECFDIVVIDPPAFAKSLAKKHNAAVWDLFEVMGGLGSIKDWIAAGLANSDKIHLLKPGYELVADLMFNALMQAYDQHLKIVYQNNPK